MAALAKLLDVMLRPDSSRTVVRPFRVGDPDKFAVKGKSRADRVVERVMALDEAALDRELKNVTRSLDERHEHVTMFLRDRFKSLEDLDLDRAQFNDKQVRLIGAYFSEEFSFESAALFNPSAVPHPDQTGAGPGGTRFIISLRGIGEGHVSSLCFRTGIWKADGTVEIDDPGRRAVGPRVDMPDLENPDGKRTAELSFDPEIDTSEAVIFPFLPSQGRGIEDCRLCVFTEDDGSTHYKGTFTAFSGADTRQAVLQTSDFRNFVARRIDGELSGGKGMAWFPRKIDGRYFMLGRQDNENVWLLSSEDPFTWNGGERLLGPKFPWEFIQMGNCGSPIEIEEGWLVLTHGVGTVRNYCVGAALLDKADPSKVLGRLSEPLIEPGAQRDGYVPNVVYSCGGFVRGRTLLLPYGVADNFATFATVELDDLVKAMG